MRTIEPFNNGMFGEDLLSKSGWLLSLFFAAAAIGIALIANATPASAASMMDDRMFKTALSGSEEVPATTSTAQGIAHFTISPDNKELHYSVIVHNLENAVGAHLHCAPRGQNGPVVATLFSTTNPHDVHGELATGKIMEDDISVAGMGCSPSIRTLAHLAQAMREGRIYANVHTVQHPDGDIRGQVMLNLPNGKAIQNGSRSYLSPTTTFGTGFQGQGFDIVQIPAVATGTTRYILTVHDSLMKQLTTIIPQVLGMFMGLFNR